MLFFAPSCKEKERPVTSEEAKEFARQLEIAASKKDASFFDEAVDKKELINRTGISNDRDAREFGSGVQEGMRMGTQITNALKDNGHYQLVKQYEKNKSQHLIFRLYADGSINYHDLELKHTKGEVKVADIFIYLSGENLSETIKGLYLQFSDLIKSTEKQFTTSWYQKLPLIRQKIDAGNYQEAFEIYNMLPEEAKKTKPFQLLNLQICSGLNDNSLYQKAIDAYMALYANEPNMHLLLIDVFIVNKQYDKALNSINQVDKMINKDPFLDYYRYFIYNIREEKSTAKRHLLQVVKNFPDFPEAQLELIATYLEERDYTAAKPLVNNYQRRKSYEQTTLSNLLLAYPEFKQ
jgi:hypothetical protein